MNSLFLFSLICFLSPFLFGGKGWNQFRGDTAQGHADASLPTLWSPGSKNIKWRTIIPGKAWSSPILADGNIVFIPAHILTIGHDAVQNICFEQNPNVVVVKINGKNKRKSTKICAIKSINQIKP